MSRGLGVTERANPGGAAADRRGGAAMTAAPAMLCPPRRDVRTSSTRRRYGDRANIETLTSGHGSASAGDAVDRPGASECFRG